MPINLLAAALSVAAVQTPVASPSFDYDRSKPVDVQFTDATGASVRQMTYAQLDGTRNTATLVTPTATSGQSHPSNAAVLFVHWYEPPRPTSNRTEFLAEALELAADGVTSLLIDTPWTGERWFPTRDSNQDYNFSVQHGGCDQGTEDGEDLRVRTRAHLSGAPGSPGVAQGAAHAEMI